jgi:DNA-binding HxlR family transcriptional regulator
LLEHELRSYPAHRFQHKMLTQTLRHMERDGLITRTAHPVVPPKAEYKLMQLDMSHGDGLLRGMDLGRGEHQTR